MLINLPSVCCLKILKPLIISLWSSIFFIKAEKKGNYAASYICLQGTEQLITRMISKCKRKFNDISWTIKKTICILLSLLREKKKKDKEGLATITCCEGIGRRTLNGFRDYPRTLRQHDRMPISMHIAVTWFTAALHLGRCLKQVYKSVLFFFLSQNSVNMDKSVLSIGIFCPFGFSRWL